MSLSCAGRLFWAGADCEYTGGAIHNKGVAAKSATMFLTSKCFLMVMPQTSCSDYVHPRWVQLLCQRGRKILQLLKIQRLAVGGQSRMPQGEEEIRHVSRKIAIQHGR